MWQMGMAHASLLGSNLDSAAVTSVKKQFLRGAPASPKPLTTAAVTTATSNVGALANSLEEIWAVILGPSAWVVNRGKAAKQNGITAWVMRTQM